MLDGATGGKDGFFFLPPLVSNPAVSGVFDASLSPTVYICEWAGVRCGPLVSQFSKTGGTGSEAIRVDATSETYIVNWQTDQCSWGPCTLDPTKVYRIQVRIGAAELGYADVQVFSTAKEAKNSSTGSVISLISGRTLPIKFRVERGAIAVVASGSPVTVGASGGAIGSADAVASLSIPRNALGSAVPITITTGQTQTAPADPALVAGTVVDFGPDGTTFAVPVRASIVYDPTQLPVGVQEAMLRLYTVVNGSWVQVVASRVDPATHTVTGEITHFSTYGVLPQRIRFAPGEPAMGRDQVVRQDVVLSAPSDTAIVFSVTNRNSTLTVAEPGTSVSVNGGQAQNFGMPAGAMAKDFTLVSNSLGQDTLVVSAVGYRPDTLVIATTLGNLLVTGWPQTLAAGDSVALTLIGRYPSGDFAGMAHDKVFTLTSTSNVVFRRNGQAITSVTIAAGNFQSTTFYMKAIAGGAVSLTIGNADYEPYTNTTQVPVAALGFAPGERAIGLGQIAPQDIVVASPTAAGVTLSLRNLNGALRVVEPGTSNNTFGGETGTYLIPPGSTSKRINLLGLALGVDTLIVSAPGYATDTLIVAATLGKLLLSGWPTTLQAGDSAQVSIIQTFPSGDFAGAGFTETYALSTSPNLVLARNGQAIQSINITGFQSPAFYVKALGAGPGTLSISNSHYEPFSATTATYQVWDAAADFAGANVSGQWTAGWTATLGATFYQYPDQYSLDYDGDASTDRLRSWSDHAIRVFDTPSYTKNVSSSIHVTIPSQGVALHPGCRSSEYSVLRWTAPATATYEVSASFFTGDEGNTSAHILKNGSTGPLLFDVASTNMDPAFAAAIALSAGETLDFAVGTTADGCFSDFTPIAVRIVRRQ